MPQEIVQLSNIFLKSDRGSNVFRGLNFTLHAGESAIVIGAAGSGKTLLTELLLGLRFPESGSIALFGESLEKRKRHRLHKMRRKIGGVGGPFELLPNMTVAENITLPLIIGGERRRTVRERLRKILAEFSLLRQASSYPAQLTRVERTLALFARASIANQPLIIIDEPMVGLDTRTAERIFQWLTRVAVSGRSMILLSSDKLSVQLPQTSHFHLENGVLT